MENYKLFSNWLNHILEQEIPKGIKAFNFNLYEGSGETYDIHLIGSDEFDEDDSDWACTDYFSSEEDIFSIKRSGDIQHWEQGLNYITMLVERYLKEGEFANILKSASAIGIGFVDGDIDILFRA
ncbi:hypothetical protein EDM52_22030 [Brevibacillus invocatus]|uniref:Uncharacterized protein n=1 Tax=Brevibacillus invocatus TaxID=173959 RepID=A0A3M8BW89_9BACL|nr:hypothetical protein [Brevibacillus invocatus]RNB67712.1 hypothetical protein EDM52_22030 [Brevibacillus invocatus]